MNFNEVPGVQRGKLFWRDQSNFATEFITALHDYILLYIINTLKSFDITIFLDTDVMHLVHTFLKVPTHFRCSTSTRPARTKPYASGQLRWWWSPRRRPSISTLPSQLRWRTTTKQPCNSDEISEMLHSGWNSGVQYYIMQLMYSTYDICCFGISLQFHAIPIFLVLWCYDVLWWYDMIWFHDSPVITIVVGKFTMFSS